MSDYGTTPPPPPPPGMGGYGAAPAPMGGGPVEHPKGTTILVLGIVSLVCCGPVGIAAWVMGNNALREIDANPAAYSNRQTVNIGRILGMVAVGLMIVGIVVYAVIFIGALGVSSNN